MVHLSWRLKFWCFTDWDQQWFRMELVDQFLLIFLPLSLLMKTKKKNRSELIGQTWLPKNAKHCHTTCVHACVHLNSVDHVDRDCLCSFDCEFAFWWFGFASICLRFIAFKFSLIRNFQPLQIWVEIRWFDKKRMWKMSCRPMFVVIQPHFYLFKTGSNEQLWTEKEKEEENTH